MRHAARLLAIVAALSGGAETAATPDARQRPPRGTPTFAGDVGPLIHRACISCHRPGQAAPFSLLSYDDVRSRGTDVAEVTARRYMPPWHATKAPGFVPMRDDRSLSDAEIALVKRWVDGGMPAGDLRRARQPPAFPTAWALGVPDLQLTLPRALAVPADGPDVFRNVTIALDLPDDRWITAIDYQPSARSVVHHALFFAGPAGVVVNDGDPIPGLGLGLRGRRGRPIDLAAADGAAAAAWTGLGGWVPGVTPRLLPDGIALPLPRRSNLVMQFHLHPSGRAEREDGRLALYFASKRPQKTLTTVQVPPLFGVGAGIDIPAGDSRYVVSDRFALPVDLEAVGARGHAHYLGREMTLLARLPGGETRGLLRIADWDFAWQDTYYFRTAQRLPKGTVIDATIVYDNSAGNPRNPFSPPRRVTWGRESVDEMGSLTLLAVAPAEPDRTTLQLAQAEHLRRQILRRLGR
jgi:hypothetical protein